MNTHTQTANAWYALDAESVLQSLGGHYQGLTEEEAATRLSVVGPNALPSAPGPSWWLIGLRQFRSPLIYILALAAVVSTVIGKFTDAGFIAAVLLMNALIGGFQEWRAERSTQALQKLLRMTATVIRNGQANEIDAERVVPGDVISLESGNRVPADLRLLNANGLETDESLLTGESIAVAKNPAWTGSTDTPLADRVNMAFAGSFVTRGRGKGVVTATGTSTHVGSLALDVMKTAGGKPPLLIRLERFTKVIGIVILVAVVLIAVDWDPVLWSRRFDDVLIQHRPGRGRNPRRTAGCDHCGACRCDHANGKAGSDDPSPRCGGGAGQLHPCL